jgi:hypothetical protein
VKVEPGEPILKMTPYSVPAGCTAGTGDAFSLAGAAAGTLPYPVPSPVTAQRYDATALPRSHMGDYIEGRIKADMCAEGEHVAAEATVLKVVSSCDQVCEVNRNVHEGFAGSDEGYAEELAYRSKGAQTARAIAASLSTEALVLTPGAMHDLAQRCSCFNDSTVSTCCCS